VVKTTILVTSLLMIGVATLLQTLLGAEFLPGSNTTSGRPLTRKSPPAWLFAMVEHPRRHDRFACANVGRAWAVLCRACPCGRPAPAHHPRVLCPRLTQRGYIDGWYNPHRIQRELGWLSPDEYEKAYYTGKTPGSLASPTGAR
jgi:hypothetical protein